MSDETRWDRFLELRVKLERAAREANTRDELDVEVDALELAEFVRIAGRLPTAERERRELKDLVARARAAHREEGGAVGAKNAAAAQVLGLARKGVKGPRVPPLAVAVRFAEARCDRPNATTSHLRTPLDVIADIHGEFEVSENRCRQILRDAIEDLEALHRAGGSDEWPITEVEHHLEMLRDVPTAPILRE